MSAAAAALVVLSSVSAAGWEPLRFKKVQRATEYAYAEGAFHAVSSASSSGMIFRLSGPAAERPVLSWRWKVNAPLVHAGERAKDGDDFAARVYVTFRYEPRRAGLGTRAKYALAKALYGEYPPHAGIAYVWAGHEPAGSSWPNPYTDRVRMLAVRSGSAGAGTWAAERRDLLADYAALFGEPPPPLAGVAVMTDTDQTGARAEAWYADIALAAPSTGR
ncbi:MAG: DUF3047 domain-containing protein [Elusimicrobia bacterium]|nr:DUF3047 domain-containing protein [Elusimicrobiota bacterium]